MIDKTNSSNKRSALVKLMAMGSVSLVAMLLMAQVSAEPNPETRELMHKEQIRGVGRALLQAKRSYQPGGDSQQIRQELPQLRAMVDALRSPQNEGVLEVDAAQDSASVSVNRHAPRVEQIRNKTRNLLARSERATRRGHSESHQARYTPINKPVVDRLSGLNAKITQAMALPGEQRQQRLEEISENLEIRSKPRHLLDAEREQESPTFTSRTEHRRSFNSGSN